MMQLNEDDADVNQHKLNDVAPNYQSMFFANLLEVQEHKAQ
jgi:hypothetical protein